MQGTVDLEGCQSNDAMHQFSDNTSRKNDKPRKKTDFCAQIAQLATSGESEDEVWVSELQ